MSRAEKTVGNLTIYDNGKQGLSYLHRRKNFCGKIKTQYGGITREEMMDYSLDENLPFDKHYTDEEKRFFIKEYDRIKWKN